MSSQLSKVSQPVIDVKLLIDTNIYLDFYRSNKDSIQLLSELSKHFDKIILTDQIIQEFERNREVVLKTLRSNFELESRLKYISSAYLQNIPEFITLCAVQKEYEKSRKDVIAAIDNILESPEKDPVYSFFLEMVSECRKNNSILNTTDEIIKKAHKRKLVGNPPTSSGYSIGDEINWEIVIANIKENIILIGRDNTYTTNFSFLKRDFHLHTGCLISKVTNSITEALKEIGFNMTTELENVEQKMLDELKAYNEFWKYSSKQDESTNES
ncbi:PIN domain-containing protein [Sphingobacterium multivorum]|uniref:PIN domain-containing protein n=1 Tax=Sphingobacterium multivorum TaxID=28454 RepID=UPI00289F1F59|nr:PIN domain-containing protein [Sphingobacterium multivorum]